MLRDPHLCLAPEVSVTLGGPCTRYAVASVLPPPGDCCPASRLCVGPFWVFGTEAGRTACDLPCSASPRAWCVGGSSTLWRVACGAPFLRLAGTRSWGCPGFVCPVVSDGRLGGFRLGAAACRLLERLFI